MKPPKRKIEVTLEYEATADAATRLTAAFEMIFSKPLVHDRATDRAFDNPLFKRNHEHDHSINASQQSV